MGEYPAIRKTKKKGNGVGRRLRELRVQKGVSIKDMAARLNVSSRRISDIELKGDCITMASVVKYVRALGASIYIGFPGVCHDPHLDITIDRMEHMNERG